MVAKREVRDLVLFLLRFRYPNKRIGRKKEEPKRCFLPERREKALLISLFFVFLWPGDCRALDVSFHHRNASTIVVCIYSGMLLATFYHAYGDDRASPARALVSFVSHITDNGQAGGIE